MINALSHLKVGRARSAKSWEEVLLLFSPREWSCVPTRSGRMAYTVLDGERESGRMLALVMMEDTTAATVFMPTGSVLFTIRGRLKVEECGREANMEAWDMVQLSDARSQQPVAQGLYLGLWAFPMGNPLRRMIEMGTR